MKTSILMLCGTLLFGCTYSMQNVEESPEERAVALTSVENNPPAITRQPFVSFQDILMTEMLEAQRNGRMARIITFDGGGIRGIIPAKWMSILEDITNKPISKMFHMMAGTSTGAIIAAGLAARAPETPENPIYSADDLVKIYNEHGSEIFHKRNLFDNPFGISKSKYQTTPVVDVFSRYFGDLKLSDFQNDVLIPYFDLTNKETKFFKSHRVGINPVYPDYNVTNVLASTTAAPTYFKPFSLEAAGKDGTGGHILAIDGGVSANDPGLCALIEGFDYYPNATSFLLVSVGTGICREHCCSHPKGLISWAKTIPGMLMGNATDMTLHIIKKLGIISHKNIFYCRIQVELPEQHSSMDDVSPKNINFLLQRASNATTELNKLRILGEILRSEITPREQLIATSPNFTINSGSFREIK